MRFFLIIIFAGYYTLSFSQNDKVFTTEPEIQYDIYYQSLDKLRDSLIFFFGERKSYIPQNYNDVVRIFFTVSTNGLINNIIFENEKNEFDSELYRLLEDYKFNGAIIKYYNGNSFNTKLQLSIKYNNLAKLLTIQIDNLCYWNDESFLFYCNFITCFKSCNSIKSGYTKKKGNTSNLATDSQVTDK